MLAAFISPWNRFRGFLADPASLRDTGGAQALVERGFTHTGSGEHRMEQYRTWPADAKAQMERQGFETARIRSLEGPASVVDAQGLACLRDDPDLRNAWLDLLRGTCKLPDILGATWHFLYVGRRPE